MEPAPRVRRRTLLGGALASAIAGAGCSPSRGTKAPPVTVASLTSSQPFYVAHRGGGGDWPEMTGYAYAQSAALPGLQALEVSVCLSADDVLVCSHDPNTKRVTGVDYEIRKQSWATLSQLEVSAAATTDPNQPGRPFTKFEDVASAYIGTFVLFAEPKTSESAQPLLAALERLGQPERVVWKQYINSRMFSAAKERGFGTWGYVLDEPNHLGDNLTRLAASPDIDMLGAGAAESNDFVSAVSDAADRNNKLTIMWPIKSPADRDRAVRLRCAGMMSSHIREVFEKPR